MIKKDFLENIRKVVKDVKNTSFEYATTKNIPSRETEGLTYESGIAKKGKEITTCILYVDVRGSVELNEKHYKDTMGKIYTAFTKSMLKIAQYHNGFVRNIIGDRVMIVFDVENCFTNAVDCAITINHTAQIINDIFTNVDFKCGIGIDYGTMKVIKVGTERKGSENTENKNLVWVGKPANIASRLTDVANKEVEKVYIKYENYNPLVPMIGDIFNIPKGLTNRRGGFITNEEITTNEEFSKNLSYNNGRFLYKNGVIKDFQKQQITFKPILMTEAVFKGVRKENPNRKDIQQNFWKEIPNHNIKNVSSKVYQGSLRWKI